MEPFRLTISRRQLELLDWPLIQNRITQACFFEHNKQAFDSNPFLMSDQIMLEQDRLENVFSKLSEIKQTFDSSIQGCPSDESAFKQLIMLKKGKVLGPEVANLAAHLIEVYEDTTRHVQPSVISENDDINLRYIIKNFLNPIRRFLDRSGNVQYEKHPKLAKVSREIHEINLSLRKQIQDVIKSNDYKDALQFEQYDVIDDRFVIPIRSDHYQARLGLIVSRSQSGMTLLVEPPKLREIASKRIQLLAKQEEILNQIFVELSSVLTENYSDFGEIISIVSKIDLLVSKASFCQEHQLSRPEISNSGDIYIKSFFHPLLDSPVTNDLSLKSSNAGLVISGPNTGGKTVALKSLAMCQILLHAGLFLPAQVATLPIARAVYYFSHDQQDLGQGLSSFSSEALQYIQLAENLEDQSFVFIDEIFNSTSSEEASALALGLLDYINENRDVKIFLSTHHQFLKTAMHADKKYLSCHVGYDFEKNSPTYKLQYHSPGSSLALSIFQKLTQNARTDLTSIFSKAKGYLDKKQVSYESLLEKLSAQKTELNKKIDEVNQLQHELKHQKKSSEGILYLEREKIREDFKLQLEKKFSEAKAWLQTFKQEIKHSGNVNKAFSKLEKQKDKHLVGFKKNKEMSKLNFNNDNEKLSISDITTGEFYFCTLTNSDVPISKVNVRKKQLQIKNKGISFWVPLSSLSQSSQKRKPQPQEIKVTVQKSEVGQVEIDGRGLRLEEFQRVVLPSLDELLCEDIPYLTVIHGHGDGILKNWLRNHLSKNQSDFDWGPDEGNDGSTTIKVSN